MDSVTNPGPSRICMVSLRGLNQQAAWCSNYEFEDVVCTLDQVDQQLRQPHRDHGRVQAVLEREPHAEVGGEAQGADDLSGAQLPGHGPSTVRTQAAGRHSLPGYGVVWGVSWGCCVDD